MSTAIVVTSGKGGTGKTSLTAAVSSCLAALGSRVLCIDMDVGLRNLDLALGLSDRALMDFTDVLAGRCTLERAAVSHPVVENLSLLTAPVTFPCQAITFPQMRALVQQAKAQYDYVLMDSPAGLGAGFELPCARLTGHCGVHNRRLRPAGCPADRHASPKQPGADPSGGQPGPAQTASQTARHH